MFNIQSIFMKDPYLSTDKTNSLTPDPKDAGD